VLVRKVLQSDIIPSSTCYRLRNRDSEKNASDQLTRPTPHIHAEKQDHKNCILTTILTLCWYRRSKSGIHHRTNKTDQIEYTTPWVKRAVIFYSDDSYFAQTKRSLIFCHITVHRSRPAPSRPPTRLPRNYARSLGLLPPTIKLSGPSHPFKGTVYILCSSF